MRVIYLFVFIVLALEMTSCSDRQPTNTEETNEDVITTSNEQEEVEAPEVEPERPTDRTYNDLARFLAGLPGEDGSTYKAYESNPGWQQYSQNADITWGQVFDNKIATMNTWRDSSLAEMNEAQGLLFYPFSGPDFLHASIFFPEVNDIVMVGLEPIGSIPDFEKISESSMTGYFNGIRQSLYNILQFSFFRTISMANDFTGKVVKDIDGTLPNIMLFMARTNHRVLYYEKVGINPEGKLVPADQIQIPEGAKDTTIYGSRIDFQRLGHPEERKTLCYFQMNLDNNPYFSRSGFQSSGLNSRTDVYTYLQNLDISSTYLKSASYLMYRENFEKVRNIILNNSEYVLQDDSGMPLKYFDRDTWDLTFYGSYYAPIPLFKVRYQADLRTVYQDKQNVQALPFGIGYQYRVGTSNLMKAVKAPANP